jgi:PPOX class probable F420-dependent enzyme
LSDPRVQAFLATREVVVLATLQPDGSPLATPMWFVHDGDALTMVSEAHTQKVRNLRRDARVSVAAEAGTGADFRGIIVAGRGELLADPERQRPLVARLLDKYAPHLRAPLARPGHAPRPRDVPHRPGQRPELGPRLPVRRGVAGRRRPGVVPLPGARAVVYRRG